MFKFLRKNRAQEFTPEYLESQIIGAIRQGMSQFSINLWIKDQILFQTGLVQHFLDKGVVSNSPEDKVIIHFFNKNKTHTVHAWNHFKENYPKLGLTYYEEPKKHDNFIKNIGKDPRNIAEEIFRAIELYQLESLTDVRYEIVQY